jgi:pullulanase
MQIEQFEELSASYTSPILPHPADPIISTQPLGALYTPPRTTFRVWAPTANQVTLHLYEAPAGGRPSKVPMSKQEDGTWEETLITDLAGKYYTYTAAGNDPRFNPHRELLDPYAQSVTMYDGRAMIVRDETPVADRPSFPISEAIIYEMHIRDFTIDPDSGIQRRGKYLGLTETGTYLTDRMDIATGLDHLVELGINVVQLMPISEFHNNKTEDQYGWGYDTVHHNSPDGWYATERFDARRVSEVKRLVDALHQLGIKVTLDVVFNHTFEFIENGIVFSFEGLVPGYYYRLQPNGIYWNGSGTGNEFRTEAPMARRYIIDSLKRWVTDYKIDGFRFDLLGLIDRETLRQAVKELRRIDPHILIYGEPWAGGPTPIEISHKGVQRSQGWAVFNDGYRDALKGNVFNARETGYIQSGLHPERVKTGIRGAIDDFADSPLETVNYVECHDNHTLWDRLVISTIDHIRTTDAARRAMDKLAAAILLTSQGIPFIHSGQEFLRTKGGDHNSYDKPDSINMLRWREKAVHFDVFEYYQGLIALRRAHPLFRFESADQVREAVKFFDDHLGISVSHGCIAYLIKDVSETDQWSRAVVIANPHAKTVKVKLPVGDWQVFGDGREVGVQPLGLSNKLIVEGIASVAPRSVLILGEVRGAADHNVAQKQ